MTFRRPPNEAGSPLTDARAKGGLAALGLLLLFLVAPFEPRYTVDLGVLRLSLVEAVALPVLGLLALSAARSQGPWLASPALRATVVFVTVAFASALGASTEPLRAFKFSLRLAMMLALALLVSRQSALARRAAFRGLAVSGAAAAALAIAEGAGLRSLDVFRGAFREIPFNVAGVRRASAGSEYPNLGAAMIVYALLAGVSLARDRPRARLLWVAFLTLGLAFTYSRGAWLAGASALVVAALIERAPLRAAVAPLGIYLGILAAFVAREEISQIRFGGENANDFYAARYVTASEFLLRPSERTFVKVSVQNTGRRPWRAGEEIHLSYHVYESDRRPMIDGPRTNLPRDVLPGDSIELQAVLRAPRNPGRYLLLWDLVHEDTTWFSGQGVTPGVAHLVVTGGSAPVGSVSPPVLPKDALPMLLPEDLGWRPSRRELWGLAMEMWASRPFLGVGPDNYRWLYGRIAGRRVFDTRIFANNMYLEWAATLGTLGLAAFLAVLFFSFAAARSLPRGDGPTTAATLLLVAMCVHGFTDYVLAFTGHYLVFGLVIGDLAAARPSHQEASSHEPGN